MNISRIKVQRLYLKVANKLSKEIKDGRIKPGERLPSERNLALLFDVSRATIREAMIALEISGLVKVKTGSGVYVHEKTQSKSKIPAFICDDSPGPLEILEARLLFEPQAAYLAAKRINEHEISLLNESLLAVEKEINNFSGNENADREFHLMIAKIGKNSAILSSITWLWDLRDESSVSKFFHEKLRSSGIKPIYSDHKMITRAIVEKRSTDAHDAMKSHLQSVMDNVLQDSS